MMIKLIVVFLLVFVNSCESNSRKYELSQSNLDSIKKPPTKESNNLKNVDKFVNDAFRRDIISNLSNPKDLKKFDTLLLALDKKGVTFCQFVQKLFQLDDSCYALAKKLYPQPEQQEDFMRIHDEAIKKSEPKYVMQFGINKSFASFASVAYSFDSNIKSYCGEY